MKNKLLILSLFGCLFLFYKCGKSTKAAEKPNILWIYLEDTSPLLGCYGTSIISTPNIDDLAAKGVLYTNAIMPAPVCSPSRSSIITGMMSTTLGLHNHHSSRTESDAIYLPDSITTLPELFQQGGYFTFNNGKDDYNFHYDRKNLYDQPYKMHPLYGKSGEAVSIKSLKEKTPFFGQIQLRGGKEIFAKTFKEKVNNHVDRIKIKLPPYLPNHPDIIEEYANHLDAIQITDEKVGQIIKDLESNDLLKNTIVFFFSDHGMRLIRHKQFLYEGGLHVPLIITDFRKKDELKVGQKNENLVSGLDLGPSALALAKLPIPDYMEGQNILDKTLPPREYVISTRDRCDFTIDRIRSVRTKNYKYIRNFMPERPCTQTTYMDVDKVKFVTTMKELHANNQLDSLQSRFFVNKRPQEELYNLQTDPYELNNLAENPAYQNELSRHRTMLENWIKTTDDKGQYPEKEEGLKLMLGIWGAYAENPEYHSIKEKYPDLAGSQFSLKSAGWKRVE